MASNAEMRRLVLHAADALSNVSGHANVVTMVREAAYIEQPALMREALQRCGAMALAEQTLRMVAACLEDDEPLPSPTLDAVPFDGEHRQTLRHRDQGNWWTTCNCGWKGPEHSGRFAAEDEWKAHATEVGQPLPHEQAGASS